MENEIIYKQMPVTSLAEIAKAEKLQAELYNKFNSVRIIPNGIEHILILVSDPIN